MNKLFATYGSILLITLMGAAHRGYAWESLFASAHHATAAENHYHK